MAVSGQQALISKLKRVRRGLPDVVASEEAKLLLVRRILARFDSQVTPDGSPWEPLKPRTIAIKKRMGAPRPAQGLYRWGALRASIGVIQGSNAGLLAVNTGMGFRIGVTDPDVAGYARIQQYGNDRIPARPFLGLSDLDIKSYRSLASRKLKRLVEGRNG